MNGKPNMNKSGKRNMWYGIAAADPEIQFFGNACGDVCRSRLSALGAKRVHWIHVRRGLPKQPLEATDAELRRTTRSCAELLKATQSYLERRGARNEKKKLGVRL